MRILVGCEESQKVTQAFLNRGYDAVSCDLKPTRGVDKYHIKGDVFEAVTSQQWDLIILHPDCTAMAVSGNRWYGHGMPRHADRLESIRWTVDLWRQAKNHSPKVVLENPVSVIFPALEKEGASIQYIQPWQFGHGETKKTGLALHGLNPLIPTNVVAGRDNRIWRMPPGPNRKRDRSETYQGIADAFADQFGGQLRVAL